MKRYVLKAILKIIEILSFKNEIIYVLNKMSEFEFERLLGNIILEEQDNDGGYFSTVREAFFLRILILLKN